MVNESLAEGTLGFCGKMEASIQFKSKGEQETMKFTKMHGIGNDYIYIDCFQEDVENPEELAIRLSDRHFGIGGDGIILILPSVVADCRMDMYNADGSRGKMCGNGIRCVAKYLFDQGMVEDANIRIETQSGIKNIKLNLRNGSLADITVDMGKPVLIPESIPVHWTGTGAGPSDRIIAETIDVGGQPVSVTCVSMGNPHTILFVDDVATAPVETLGRQIETLAMFPDCTNVEFIERVDDSTIRMRVWERGSGETLACGTGACASVVACVLNGKTKRNVCVKLTGGDLMISWDEKTGSVFMTGPAKKVFTGVVNTSEL